MENFIDVFSVTFFGIAILATIFMMAVFMFFVYETSIN